MPPPSTGDQNSIITRITTKINLVVRTAERGDLAKLEWFGEYAHHRTIIEGAFEGQERGEQILLIADLGGFPVAQVWIDLARRVMDNTGYLWAVRTLPLLQGQGIGTRLMETAESLLHERGYAAAELGVETNNPAARRFYERLGYEAAGIAQDDYSYEAPTGETVHVPQVEWVMRKSLLAWEYPGEQQP